MRPNEEDQVWLALEELRDSRVVCESRRYAAAYAGRRRRFICWRTALMDCWPRLTIAAAVASAAFLLMPPDAEILQTRLGEIRTAKLGDGSVVVLNTSSKLSVRLGWWTREVELIEGEAQFQVARDPAHPFRVTANGMTVTALGTSFDVTALPDRTTVTLLHGKVLVEPLGNSDGSNVRKLQAPGEQVRLAGDRLTAPVTTKVDATLAWQRRLVDLSGLSLAEALNEINRYSVVKIQVNNEDLQRERISGIFRVGDVNAVAEALGAFFDLEIVHRDARTVILERAQSRGCYGPGRGPDSSVIG